MSRMWFEELRAASRSRPPFSLAHSTASPFPLPPHGMAAPSHSTAQSSSQAWFGAGAGAGGGSVPPAGARGGGVPVEAGGSQVPPPPPPPSDNAAGGRGRGMKGGSVPQPTGGIVPEGEVTKWSYHGHGWFYRTHSPSGWVEWLRQGGWSAGEGAK